MADNPPATGSIPETSSPFLVPATELVISETQFPSQSEYGNSQCEMISPDPANHSQIVNTPLSVYNPVNKPSVHNNLVNNSVHNINIESNTSLNFSDSDILECSGHVASETNNLLNPSLAIITGEPVGNFHSTPASQFINLDSSLTSTNIPGTDSSVLALINSAPPSSSNSSEPCQSDTPFVQLNAISKKRKLNTCNSPSSPINSMDTSEIPCYQPCNYPSDTYLSHSSPSLILHTHKFPKKTLPPSLEEMPNDPNIESGQHSQGPSNSAKANSATSDQKLLIEPIAQIATNGKDPSTLKLFFSNDLKLYCSIN